jgi:hypothetical protein
MTFINRFNLLKNPKVIGEIIGDIGIGFLVNSMFMITQGSFEMINYIDALLGLIMIVEGSFMKYKELA